MKKGAICGKKLLVVDADAEIRVYLQSIASYWYGMCADAVGGTVEEAETHIIQGKQT